MHALGLALVACGSMIAFAGAQESGMAKDTAGWSAAVNIDTGAYDVYATSSDVAYDALGNAMCVFSQFNGAYYELYASRYTKSSGAWSAPMPIVSGGNNDNRLYPVLAGDGYGNYLCIFEWPSGKSAYSCFYDNRTGAWEYPVRIVHGPHYSYGFKVLFQHEGQARAVGLVACGSEPDCFGIYSYTYGHERGWNEEVQLDDATGDCATPSIAVDAQENMMCMWRRRGAERSDIVARHYSSAIGEWGKCIVVDGGTEDNGWLVPPAILFEPDGRALTVFHKEHSGSGSGHIYSNRFDPSRLMWGEPLAIAPEGAYGPPQLALDRNGTGFALFYVKAGWAHVNACRYEGAGAWASPVRIDAQDSVWSDEFSLALDGGGSALCVIKDYGGSGASRCLAAKYSAAGNEWGAPVPLDTGTAEQIGRPRIYGDAYGNAVATYCGLRPEGNLGLYAARYTAEQREPFIRLMTNQSVYRGGDRLVLTAELLNPEIPRRLNEYIALEEEGEYWFYDGENWVPYISFWPRNLPRDLHEVSNVLDVVLPEELPEGEYVFYAILTDRMNGDPLCELSCAPVRFIN